MRKIYWLVWFLFSTSTTALAQEDTAQFNRIKKLYFLEGTWSVDVESRLSLNGPWESSKGKSTFKKTLNENFIEEEFIGTRQGKPFLARTFFAVNNMDHKYQRTFIDGPHGVMVDFSGQEEKGTFVFDKILNFPDGRVVTLRVEYKKHSDNEFSVESMRRPSGSSTWDTTGRMKYIRANK